MHLAGMGLVPWGGSQRVQVSLAMREAISSSIASCQAAASGPERASFMVLGSLAMAALAATLERPVMR